MRSAIHTESLSKNFRSLEAIHDLNLDVSEGSIFAYLGPNGAGKTTTIKVLTNILSPSAGSARVLDVHSTRLAAAQFAQIGYISENQELPLWMSLGGFLRYCRGFYPNWDDELCQKLIRQFDLPMPAKLHTLSRGMRIKAALCSSISYRPRLLILDEPFSGLDPLVRDELVEGILGLASEQECTVFVSSHDLTEVESLASHIGYIDHGKLLFSEELASVEARFREVEVTCDSASDLSLSWPSEWMTPEASGRVVRFVVNRYTEDTTPAQIRAVFPDCKDWHAWPMTLRSIFTALAKASRTPASERER
jgi:ABC-2 type transport system ATP-binding protein